MYLYSNIVGTFVFNQNFQVREKTLFAKKDLPEISRKLVDGETLESEKKFLARFKNIQKLDANKISRVNHELKSYSKKIQEYNLYLTKLGIKNSVTDDVLIMQCSAAIDDLDVLINKLVKRVREWYSYYNPELDIVDNEAFVQHVAKAKKPELSMGGDLAKDDLAQILALAKKAQSLFDERASLEKYLEKMMRKNVPNLAELAGVLIGAKLITIAGSLKHLMLFPSSTVQLLGAEKALFRHLRNKRIKPPKYGILYQHQIVQKATNKGRAARLLADKISIAVRVDYFKGEFIAKKLRKELEEKLWA